MRKGGMSTFSSAMKQTWPHEWEAGVDTCACKHCDAVAPFPVPQKGSAWHIIIGQECAGRLRNAIIASKPGDVFLSVRLNGTADSSGKIQYTGGQKIAFIKLMRGHFAKGRDNGLKATKTIADKLQQGFSERIVITEAGLPEFTTLAAQYGVIATRVNPAPPPSEKAERLLKALRKEPALLAEMQILLAHEPAP